MRHLADDVTDGCISGLARLLGLSTATVQNQSKNGESSPVVELLAEIFDVLAEQQGDEDARDVFILAARRLGRQQLYDKRANGPKIKKKVVKK
jgi:hypothetical protein